MEQHFIISGIAGYGSSDNLAGATIALFSEATAEQVLDGQGKYDSILVSADNGVTDVVLRERLARALPSYAVAETGQQAAAAAEQSTQATISTFIGTPLLLGSWSGLACVPLFIALLMVRIPIEERMLKTELEGYADYMACVRYRLVPGIW